MRYWTRPADSPVVIGAAQPLLIQEPVGKDVVYTPVWLASAIVGFYKPTGVCLDPCAGDGAFLDCLPSGADWCEIQKGRDFFLWRTPVDWIVSNPPYSCLLDWIRHSFTVAENIVYLLPLHRLYNSLQFMQEMHAWGGIRHRLMIGTGTTAGFPFGHALAAVHFQRGYQEPGLDWL